MPPHLLVTLREVSLLVVLPGDVADVLYAQECIFVRFLCHVKILTAIFATRSTVSLVVWLNPAAGFIVFMRFRLFRMVRRLQSPRCVFSLIPNRRI